MTLRASVVGRLPKMDPPPLPKTEAKTAKEKGLRNIYLSGWSEAPVYEISDLLPGSSVNGPAILESDFTTVLVEPGDVAAIDSYGGIELRVSLEAPISPPPSWTPIASWWPRARASRCMSAPCPLPGRRCGTISGIPWLKATCSS